MRNQPETQHIYNIPRLNHVFLWSSVAALLVTVWMIYGDWDREWKVYQQENKRIEAEKVRQDLDAARQATKLDLERLDAELKKQEAAVAAKAGDRMAAQAAFEKADVAQKNADVEFKFAKADLDALKSDYEHAASEAASKLARAMKVPKEAALRDARKDPHVAAQAGALAALTARVNKLDLALQDADAARKAAEARLEAIEGARNKLKKDRERLLLDQDKAQKRLDSLVAAGLRAALDAPLLESFQPSLKVDQKILDDHRINLNFADVPRVDRCMTCHVNADKKSGYPAVASADAGDNTPVNADDLADFVDKGKEKGWVDRQAMDEFVTKTLKVKKGVTATQLNSILGALRDAGVEYRDFYRKQALPFAAHPRLDLFVGSESPHPAEKFGCTSCHWGWDRDVRFVDAAHTPDPHKQVKAEWEEPLSVLRAMFGAGAKKRKFEGSQEDYWKRRYHWHELHDLDQKMRPAKYVEAACLKCHVNVTEVPQAPKLNRGLQLIDQAGCWSCHRVKQLEHTVTHKVRPGEGLVAIARLYSVDAARITAANNLIGEPKLGQVLEIPVRKLERGPALVKIASKVRPDWVSKWLENPRAFRPNAYMPRFWGLENNGGHIHYQGVQRGDIKADDRSAVEIEAITAFVTASSQTPSLPPPPVKGDAKRGGQLVATVGCTGCHVINEKTGELKADLRKTANISDQQYRRMRTHGPMLAGTGSKTSDAWLFAWLKNPKSWNPGTRMPNLRLNDQEAADIASFLMTLRDDGFEKRGRPEVKRAVLDDVTEEYLQNSLPAKEARSIMEAKGEADRKRLDAVLHEALKGVWGEKNVAARLAGFDFDAKKKLFLGVNLVSRYGCYSCHQISGFENTKPIGTELSEWGSKATDKLDFGYLEKEIEHNNYAYLAQKLRAARSFDRTDTRRPQEWMRMPQFNFTEEQIEDIVTAVMGMTDEKVTDKAKQKLSSFDWEIESGRWLAQQYNCQGCHVLERRGGAIRATIEDPAFYPPDLFAQGARTQPEWLFKFLKAPAPIRPRLFARSRMPTFEFSDEQANTLLKYFNYLDNQDFPFEKDYALERQADVEMVNAGKQLFQKLQCVKCHNLKPGQQLTPEQANQQFPSLVLVRDRLKPKWVVDWLRDPNFFQKGTQMPAFWPDGASPFPDMLGGNAEKQMQAVGDYMFVYQGEDLGQPVAAPEAAAAPKRPAASQYE